MYKGAIGAPTGTCRSASPSSAFRLPVRDAPASSTGSCGRAASPRTTPTRSATPEQLPDELAMHLEFVLDPGSVTSGSTEFEADLSTPPEDKFVGEVDRWDRRRPRRFAAALDRSGPRVHASPRARGPSTARRSTCTSRTRSVAGGRCRRSRSTSTCPERFGARVRHRRQTSRARPFMIHSAKAGSTRAVLRCAGGALRRGVPDVAGTRCRRPS